MVSRPTIDLELLSDRALCFLHYQFANSNIMWFSLGDLVEALGSKSPHPISLSVGTLLKDRFVGRKDIDVDGNDTQCFAITTAGISYIGGWTDEHWSEIARTITFSDDGSNSHREQFPAESEGLVINDEDWAPLPIERESGSYRGAEAALTEAVAVIEGDNGYAAREPEERDQIVWSLKEGLRAIREGLPSRSQVQALLVAPLNFLAQKFSGAAMGEAAKTAVVKVVAWLAAQ